MEVLGNVFMGPVLCSICHFYVIRSRASSCDAKSTTGHSKVQTIESVIMMSKRKSSASPSVFSWLMFLLLVLS
jgi:hypothetical protein